MSSSTTGVVQFKFKHQKSFDKIEFSASEISVAELKVKILERLCLTDPKSSSGVQLFRIIGPTEQQGAAYEDDFELISSHTSVLVKRAPRAGPKDTIQVVSSGYFLTSTENYQLGDQLKESVLAQEISGTRPCPEAVVCRVCRKLMVDPVILSCCGFTVCRDCGVMDALCPVEKEFFQKSMDSTGSVSTVTQVTPHRAIARLATVVAKNNAMFTFSTVTVPLGLFERLSETVRSSEVKAEAADVIHLDNDSNNEAIDVEQPMSLKERQLMERRAMRKRKALEILAKRGSSAKLVKGELTEGEISSILKSEVKEEKLDIGVAGAVALTSETPKILIEFPKLLSREEFNRWKMSAIGRKFY